MKRAGRAVCRANQVLREFGFERVPEDEYVRELEEKYETPFEGYFEPVKNYFCEKKKSKELDGTHDTSVKK